MSVPTVLRAVTGVAVGVLVRADGAVLLADRPRGKPYAGYWEFPGGKLERGESIDAALGRELREELGVEIRAPLPWVTFEFDYPHAYVRLHFRRVFEWIGAPTAHEGQRIAFFRPDGGLPEPLLPAAVPALRWLRLPNHLIDAELARSPSSDSTISPIVSTTGGWRGAVVATRDQLAAAARSGYDFAIAELNATGWQAFRTLASDTPLPLYARGGLQRGDLHTARQAGAHGIVVAA